MKKRLRKTFAFAIALAMLVCSNLSVLAAEPTATESSVVEWIEADKGIVTTAVNSGVSTLSNIYDYPFYPRALNIDTTWKTIAYSTTGFGCNVAIASHNTAFVGLSVAKTDIRMLAKDGRVIWQESGAIRGDGVNRIFVCGTDVYTIQVRTQAGTGTAVANETTQAAN